MTDETKKHFFAPWKAEEYKHGKGAFVVRNNEGYLVAENMSKQDANRFARLPELYDALMQAAKRCCSSADDKCPKQGAVMWAHCRKCTVLPWLELLRKVRDGE